jgi:hypothetical protein
MFGVNATTEAAAHSAIIDLRNISSLHTMPPRNVDSSSTVPFPDVVITATKCPNARLTSARPPREACSASVQIKIHFRKSEGKARTAL